MLILIDPSTLQKLFIDRAFAVMDRQKDGRVVVDEYTETLAQLAGKNADAAIEFLFRIYDINEDGTLELGELKEVLKASIAESGMTFDDQVRESDVHKGPCLALCDPHIPEIGAPDVVLIWHIQCHQVDNSTR